MTETCNHLEQAAKRQQGVVPSGEGCAECLAVGSDWVHLRLCLTCGHVGCCDNSPNRHATGHFHETKHPVARSFEPDEGWGYCYADHIFVDELPARFKEESPPVHYYAP